MAVLLLCRTSMRCGTALTTPIRISKALHTVRRTSVYLLLPSSSVLRPSCVSNPEPVSAPSDEVPSSATVDIGAIAHRQMDLGS